MEKSFRIKHTELQNDALNYIKDYVKANGPVDYNGVEIEVCELNRMEKLYAITNNNGFRHSCLLEFYYNWYDIYAIADYIMDVL